MTRFSAEHRSLLCLLLFLSSASGAPPLGNEEAAREGSPIRPQKVPIVEDDLLNSGFKRTPSESSFLFENEEPDEDNVNTEQPFSTGETSTLRTEKEAEAFMQQISREHASRRNTLYLRSWDFENNITDTSRRNYVRAKSDYSDYFKQLWTRIQDWKTHWPKYTNETLKRQFKLYSVLGLSALSKEKFDKLTSITTEMKIIYSKAKICDFKNPTKCDLSLDPEIKNIMKTSRDYEELTHVWKSWRDAAGKPSRNLYTTYVELINEASVLNGFPSSAEMWMHDYESDTFENDVAHFYEQLRPLYEQLHAYTRRKLREEYGESRISKEGPIPAHVTGNMWAQTWADIYDILNPYPNKMSFDVTNTMKKQGYTPRLMFEKADNFFASLNLERVPDSFWNNSVIEKPSDREIVCHASAWDFSDGKDFRIKQCTKVDMEDFFTVHHELGHIQYYLLYKDLPFIFQRGANPGFHEAVGDVMSLSVSTPKHLQKVGLLNVSKTDEEDDINFLLKAALQKVAFLPFAYMVDKYRWDVLREKITPANYTKAWWDYRYQLQGIAPPVTQTEGDFDPAAKFHVSGDVRYIRYFVSYILQFQLHKAACLLANEYDPTDPLKPLHRCDIYQSKEAGKGLRDMLKLGRSVHWSDALKTFIGSGVMDASALREYFHPLEEWLIADNKKHGEFIGWKGGYEQISEKRHSKSLESLETVKETDVKTETAVAADTQPTDEESVIKSSENAKNGSSTPSSENAAETSTTEIHPTFPTEKEEIPIIRQDLGQEHETMTESDAQLFIQKINNETSSRAHNLTLLSWNYQTNITDDNKKKYLDLKNAYGDFEKDRWNRIQRWKTNWPTFANKTLQRQFKRYSVLRTAALPEDKLERLNTLTVEMRENFSTRKICDYKLPSKCDLSLEPDIENILKSSRDYDELLHVWKSWRDQFRPIRELFSELVRLSNEAALINDFPSSAEMWMHDYESETFEKDVARLYEQLKPLYEQLHAYTRRKLREVYGESKISKRGPIPAHVTGNMWAQSWDNIYDILIPYPNKTSVDVTEEMISQGYTPRLMFEKADDFFASLGLERVPDSFWNNSVIEKPDDREIVCHASAWDFSNRKDFRIKQCTSVDMEDFFTVHHEMGHVQYYMQYKDLPVIFRRGANPGFHEAVGDLMSLSVSIPKHLHKVGLLDKYEKDDEADINFLLLTALSNVAFLPFGYMIDKYRWEIFRGSITPDNYTKAWWQHRYELQGMKPPVLRSEEDFDPAAKSHVSSNTRYIRYFVARILQFQFHKAACLLANEYDPFDPLKPLHRCDIYQSKEAGTAIKNMLKPGASKQWSEPLKAFTGSEVMDASALREYFRPLEEWLIADNKKHREFIGWEGGYENPTLNESGDKEVTALNVQPTDEESMTTGSEHISQGSSAPPSENASEISIAETHPTLSTEKEEVSIIRQDLRQEGEAMTESDAQLFIQKINDETSSRDHNITILSWNYQTNITDDNKKKYVDAANAYGAFQKDRWNRIQKWKAKWPTFANKTLQRQFKRYSVLGSAALPKDKLERLNMLTVNMSKNYSTRKICDYKIPSKCDLSLEPDIEKILKSSRDYDELSHVWKAWRDQFRPMREIYAKFADLSNEAALLNDFPSTAEMWMHEYESETFEKDVARLYEQLKPLYEQLHAYTRRKLREVYGVSKISKRGPIPAHVTGNMWAQSWDNIYDILIPYPNKTSVDVTEEMISQGYTPRLMFEKADDFFASLGLERVPDSFWNNSVIEKPDDREIVCHASAWDFSNRKDFRIKQCTSVDMEDFFTVHHELGHVQYYMQYKDLPVIFRRGANPGFHEAVGDLMSLSVSTPKHLHKVGLLDKYEKDDEVDINFLLLTALSNVAFLPFGYMIDKYRWEIFRGSITPDNYTKAWWQYRYELQGVYPPVIRTEEDFDPVAKFHVSANHKYMRYFVARILQFQFHKAACLLANEYDPSDPLKPLHRCDIYQSKEAGTAIKNMLKPGASKHWSEPLKALTGSEVMDASDLREYFRPLEEWLIADNKKHREFIGWEEVNDFLRQIG